MGPAQEGHLRALIAQQAAVFEERLKVVEARTLQAISDQQAVQQEAATGWDSRFAGLERAAATATARQDATYTLMAGMHQMLLDSATRSDAAHARRKRIWSGQGGHNARRKLLPTPPAAPHTAPVATAHPLTQSPVVCALGTSQG